MILSFLFTGTSVCVCVCVTRRATAFRISECDLQRVSVVLASNLFSGLTGENVKRRNDDVED